MLAPEILYTIPVTDRDEIRYDAFEPVLLAAISQGEISQVLIRAHTDSVGSREANLALSTAWANDLRDWIAARGVPLDVISAEGFGEDQPLEIAEDGAPSTLNQRIEIEIRFAG